MKNREKSLINLIDSVIKESNRPSVDEIIKTEDIKDRQVIYKIMNDFVAIRNRIPTKDN